MWCWRRMLRVSWIEHCTNENILSELNERRKELKAIRTRQWNMMGNVLRHKNELTLRLIKWIIEGKRDRRCPRTLFVKQNISEARLTNYTELKST
jgi:hypothetical protein